MTPRQARAHGLPVTIASADEVDGVLADVQQQYTEGIDAQASRAAKTLALHHFAVSCTSSAERQQSCADPPPCFHVFTRELLHLHLNEHTAGETILAEERAHFMERFSAAPWQKA
jgi:hypothetical protein